MSVELQTIERLFDAVHRNDYETYAKCFAENAEYKVANFPPVFGPEGIAQFAAPVVQMFSKVTHDIKALWEVDDAVIVEGDPDIRSSIRGWLHG